MPTTLNDLLRMTTGLVPDAVSDGELLGRYANQNDEAAFHCLVRRHAAMVLGTCRRILGNLAEAEDAFQVTFVVLVRKAHTLTAQPCLGAFLYGVAYHTALKIRATTVKRRVKEARVARPEPSPDQSELLAALDEELAGLPEKYRAPVVLCELEGRSRREAAKALGVPEGTISSRLATAHRMLERRLRSRGFTGACVAAVLAAVAGRAAGTDALCDVALKAVLAPTSHVSQLATEVTKMMLLHKIGLGAAVLTALLVGIAIAGNAVGTPHERPNALAVAKLAAAPVPPAAEPGWAKNFNAAYQLKEGEYVKRVPSPFIPERGDFVRVRFPGVEGKSLAGLLTMGVLFAESDGKTVAYRAMVSTDAIDFDQPTKQVRKKRLSLRSVISYSTGRMEPEVVFDERSKHQGVFMECDFVIRKGAPLEKLLPDLQKAIGQCEMDMPRTHPILSLKEEEQDVYVVSGKLKVAPRKWRTEAEVDVYADESVLNREFTEARPDSTADVNTNLIAGLKDSPVQFARELGAFVNRRLVWEAEAPETLPFRVYAHARWENKATANEQAADRDPEKVLKNVSEQTGLLFKKEKRKVQVLYASTPQPKP